MTDPAHRSRRRSINWAVAAVLTLHFLLAVTSKLRESTTTDELAHLTAGFAYWELNDYRLQPENGNLPQRWAALPTWLAGARFPKLEDNGYWRTSDAWVVGHQFFYETGEDHFPRLMAGRAMIGLFSVATGLLIFVWSRRFFGVSGAFVALGFYAFCPNFLAHGALVTSDVCLTFFMLASVGAWWRHLHDGRLRTGILSALVFGLACVAKYSAVLLIPMFALLAVARAFAPSPFSFAGRTFSTPVGKLGASALSALGHGGAAIAIIWASFGFRYTAFHPGLPDAAHFIQPFESAIAGMGAQGPLVTALAAWRALPEAFLYGYAFVIEMSQQRAAYLDGDYSITGWLRFFPLAFLYKSTPALLVALPLAGFVAMRHRFGLKSVSPSGRALLYPALPLLVIVAVYGGFSLTSNLNIGHRHLLPVYPVLFIATGALGAWAHARRGVATAIVALLLALQMGSAAWIYPHYLAYFNPLAGGPALGWRHLADSSLDWGQDLPGLKAWISNHVRKDEPVFLGYAGSGEPDYYQLPVRRLMVVNGFHQTQRYIELEPGVYCIGATVLTHVYGQVRGPWTLELEREYQSLRPMEPFFARYDRDPEGRAALLRDAPAERWEAGWKRFNVLRFARLCHYLRLRTPDANIGHSILIYRLSAEELAAGTAGTLADWSALLERAVSAR